MPHVRTSQDIRNARNFFSYEECADAYDAHAVPEPLQPAPDKVSQLFESHERALHEPFHREPLTQINTGRPPIVSATEFPKVYQ
jgi:hypothetical protein